MNEDNQLFQTKSARILQILQQKDHQIDCLLRNLSLQNRKDNRTDELHHNRAKFSNDSNGMALSATQESQILQAQDGLELNRVFDRNIQPGDVFQSGSHLERNISQTMSPQSGERMGVNENVDDSNENKTKQILKRFPSHKNETKTSPMMTPDSIFSRPATTDAQNRREAAVSAPLASYPISELSEGDTGPSSRLAAHSWSSSHAFGNRSAVGSTPASEVSVDGSLRELEARARFRLIEEKLREKNRELLETSHLLALSQEHSKSLQQRCVELEQTVKRNSLIDFKRVTATELSHIWEGIRGGHRGLLHYDDQPSSSSTAQPPDETHICSRCNGREQLSRENAQVWWSYVWHHSKAVAPNSTPANEDSAATSSRKSSDLISKQAKEIASLRQELLALKLSTKNLESEHQAILLKSQQEVTMLTGRLKTVTFYLEEHLAKTIDALVDIAEANDRAAIAAEVRKELELERLCSLNLRADLHSTQEILEAQRKTTKGLEAKIAELELEVQAADVLGTITNIPGVAAHELIEEFSGTIMKLHKEIASLKSGTGSSSNNVLRSSFDWSLNPQSIPTNSLRNPSWDASESMDVSLLSLKIEEYQLTITDLKNQVKSLEDEIASGSATGFASSLEDAQNLREKFDDSILHQASLKKQLRKVKADLEESQNQLDSRSSENERLRRLLSQSDIEAQLQLGDRLHSTISDPMRKRDDMAGMTNGDKGDEDDEIIAELKRSLQERTIQKKILEDSLRAVEATTMAYNRVDDGASSDWKSQVLIKRIIELTFEASEQSKAEKRLSDNITEKSLKLRQLQKHNNILDQKVAKYETNITRLQDEINCLKASIEQNLTNHHQEIVVMRNDKEKLQSIIDEMSIKIDSLNIKLTQSRKVVDVAEDEEYREWTHAMDIEYCDDDLEDGLEEEQLQIQLCTEDLSQYDRVNLGGSVDKDRKLEELLQVLYSKFRPSVNTNDHQHLGTRDSPYNSSTVETDKNVLILLRDIVLEAQNRSMRFERRRHQDEFKNRLLNKRLSRATKDLNRSGRHIIRLRRQLYLTEMKTSAVVEVLQESSRNSSLLLEKEVKELRERIWDQVRLLSETRHQLVIERKLKESFASQLQRAQIEIMSLRSMPSLDLQAKKHAISLLDERLNGPLETQLKAWISNQLHRIMSGLPVEERIVGEVLLRNPDIDVFTGSDGYSESKNSALIETVCSSQLARLTQTQRAEILEEKNKILEEELQSLRNSMEKLKIWGYNDRSLNDDILVIEEKKSSQPSSIVEAETTEYLIALNEGVAEENSHLRTEGLQMKIQIEELLGQLHATEVREKELRKDFRVMKSSQTGIHNQTALQLTKLRVDLHKKHTQELARVRSEFEIEYKKLAQEVQNIAGIIFQLNGITEFDGFTNSSFQHQRILTLESNKDESEGKVESKQVLSGKATAETQTSPKASIYSTPSIRSQSHTPKTDVSSYSGSTSLPSQEQSENKSMGIGVRSATPTRSAYKISDGRDKLYDEVFDSPPFYNATAREAILEGQIQGMQTVLEVEAARGRCAWEQVKQIEQMFLVFQQHMANVVHRQQLQHELELQRIRELEILSQNVENSQRKEGNGIQHQNQVVDVHRDRDRIDDRDELIAVLEELRVSIVSLRDALESKDNAGINGSHRRDLSSSIQRSTELPTSHETQLLRAVGRHWKVLETQIVRALKLARSAQDHRQQEINLEEDKEVQERSGSIELKRFEEEIKLLSDTIESLKSEIIRKDEEMEKLNQEMEVMSAELKSRDDELHLLKISNQDQEERLQHPIEKESDRNRSRSTSRTSDAGSRGRLRSLSADSPRELYESSKTDCLKRKQPLSLQTFGDTTDQQRVDTDKEKRLESFDYNTKNTIQPIHRSHKSMSSPLVETVKDQGSTYENAVNAQRQMEYLKQEMNRKTKLLKELRQCRSADLELIAQQKDRISVLTEKILRQQNLLSSKEAAIKALRDKSGDSESGGQASAPRIDRRLNLNLDSPSTVSPSQSTAEDIQQQLRAAESKYQNQRDRANALKSQLNLSHEEITALKTQIEGLKAATIKAESDKSTIMRKDATIKSLRDERDQERKDWEAAKEAVRKETKKFQKQIVTLERRCSALQGEIEVLKKRNTELEQKIHSLTIEKADERHREMMMANPVKTKVATQATQRKVEVGQKQPVHLKGRRQNKVTGFEREGYGSEEVNTTTGEFEYIENSERNSRDSAVFEGRDGFSLADQVESVIQGTFSHSNSSRDHTMDVHHQIPLLRETDWDQNTWRDTDTTIPWSSSRISSQTPFSWSQRAVREESRPSRPQQQEVFEMPQIQKGSSSTNASWASALFEDPDDSTQKTLSITEDSGDIHDKFGYNRHHVKESIDSKISDIASEIRVKAMPKALSARIYDSNKDIVKPTSHETASSSGSFTSKYESNVFVSPRVLKRISDALGAEADLPVTGRGTMALSKPHEANKPSSRLSKPPVQRMSGSLFEDEDPSLSITHEPSQPNNHFFQRLATDQSVKMGLQPNIFDQRTKISQQSLTLRSENDNNDSDDSSICAEDRLKALVTAVLANSPNKKRGKL